MWFIGLQVFRIGHLCPWCLAAHACGVTMTALLLWKPPAGVRQLRRTAGLSLIGAFILVGGQLLAAPADTFEIQRDGDQSVDDGVLSFEPDEGETPAAKDDPPALPMQGAAVDRFLPFLLGARSPLFTHIVFQEQTRTKTATPEQTDPVGTQPKTSGSMPADDQAVTRKKLPPRLIPVAALRTNINMRQWPVLGNPDARYVVVEMFDYTCPHCRNMNRSMQGAFKHFKKDLAVVTLPVPLNSLCNDAVPVTGPRQVEACEIARIAIAVWRVKPEKFHYFNDWLFQPESGWTAAEARRHASEVVGEKPLVEELSRPQAAAYITKLVEIYKRAGAGTVPKLLFPKSTLVGEISSVEQLCRTIEREIPVSARPAAGNDRNEGRGRGNGR